MSYELHLPGALPFLREGRRDLTLRLIRPGAPWHSPELWGQAIRRGNGPMHVDAGGLVFSEDGRVAGSLEFHIRWRRVVIELDGRHEAGKTTGLRVRGMARGTVDRRDSSKEHTIALTGRVRPATLSEVSGLTGNDANWPDWPAKLHWDRVIDITTVAGDNWNEKIETAQDRLAGSGGVIWFPPGEYRLVETVRLRSGVILRGSNPGGSGDPRDPRYDLPSRLIFPRYQPTFRDDGTPVSSAFKGIELADPNGGRDVGVVNLDLRNGHIHLGRWQGFARRFAEDTASRRLLVCGNLLRNAATIDPEIPRPWQHPWQRWTNRHRAAIHCYAQGDVLISGNRIPASGEGNFVMEGFRLYKDKPATHEQPRTREVTTIDVPFDYDNRPGIMVNPDPLAEGLAVWKARDHSIDPPSWGLARGIVIRGNYVFCTGCVAIKTSGDGTFVGYNVIRYRPGVIRPTYTGLTLSNFTNNNRAVEMKGWRWTVQGNDYEVYSNYGPTGTKYNDGEGIMHEAWENVGVRDSRIIGNRGNAYICLWRVPVRGLEIRDNHIRTGGGQPAITVLGQTNRDVDLPVERVKITGNVTEGAGIKLTGDPGRAGGNEIRDNRCASPGCGTIRNGAGATVGDNEGY